MRQVSGLSLVALLCATALAPVAAAGMAVGPVVLASVGLVGGIGAGKLGEVVDDALDALRHSGEPVTEETVQKALAKRLESALAGTDAANSALREAAAVLLRELGAVRGEVAEGLAGLGTQFAEFSFVAEEIRRTVWTIDASLRSQLAENRAASQRAREEILRLTRALESPAPGLETATGARAAANSAWLGCPYLGLVPFGAREAQVFYGRRDLTLRLRQALAERLSLGGLLLVTGPSGAGKSSLLRAGLVPALARDVLGPGSGRWPCRVLTPTVSPLRELAAHLADLAGQDPGTALAKLSLRPAAAAELADEGLRVALGPRPAGAAAPRLVLIVDQFEELFSLTAQDEAGLAERTAFVEALDALAALPDGREAEPAGLVAVSVRGDFLDQVSAFAALARAQEAGAFVVGPMTEAQLRLAVTGPAAEARLGVDQDLVDEVIREVRDRPDGATLGTGVLPLVSHAMAATWENRDGDRLTLLDYLRVGGLADAVNRAAQETYQQLDESQRDIARMVFLRLTVLTADGRAVRRRAARAELYQSAGATVQVDAKSGEMADADTVGAVDTVIEAFASCRLLVLEHGAVEISHDVLLHSWSELQDWLGSDRVDRVLYGKVVADAESWREHGDHPSYLYQSTRLAEVADARTRWAADPERYPVLPQPAVDFLLAGRAAARRRVRLRRSVIAGLTALTLIAAGTAVDARENAADARAQHALSLSRQLAAQSVTLAQVDPHLADRLATAAWSVSHTPQANAAMVNLATSQATSTHIGESGYMQTVLFSPDGATVATATSDVTGGAAVQFWNPATGLQIGPTINVSDQGLGGMVYSPNGTMLATADETDGTVRLWSPQSGREIGRPMQAASKSAGVGGVAFNPAGMMLASADGDGTIRLWNPATDQEIGAPINAPSTSVSVTAVDFNPAGTTLAAAYNDGTIRLWNPATGTQSGATIDADDASDGVNSIVFSPDGATLASADADGTARLWDPTTGTQIGAPLITSTAANGAVQAVAFNPSGSMLATADNDGTIRLWNPATYQEIGAPLGSGAAIGGTAGGPAGTGSVAFSPDGRTLAGAYSDGVAELWDPDTGQPRLLLSSAVADEEGEYGVAFNPTGTVLADAGGDGAVQLWNPVTGQAISQPLVASAAGANVITVAYSANGRILAEADADGTVRAWNPGTRQQIGPTIIAAASKGLAGLAVDPCGGLLATADSDDGMIRLWNPATGHQTGTITTAAVQDTGVSAAAFSPDGKILADIDNSGQIQLWNPISGQQIGATFDNPGLELALPVALAFSPDGRILAAAYGDGTVKLWSPITGRQVGATIATTSAASGAQVTAMAFSVNGAMLATANENGAVQLWDPTTNQEIGAPIDTGPGIAVDGLAFDAANMTLAGATDDGSLLTWNLSAVTDPYQLLCTDAGAPTAAQWREYAPGEAQPADCR